MEQQYFSDGHKVHPNELRNMQIRLDAVRKLAEKRLPGFYDEVVSRGKVEGEVLYIHSRDFLELRQKYSRNAFAPPAPPRSIPGPVVTQGIAKPQSQPSSPYFSIKPISAGCRSCGK
jgi:hypothetical protein